MTGALGVGGFMLRLGRTARALGCFALAAALGCALVWARASWVEQPRLNRPVVTDVSGVVESVDHLAARGTVRLMIAPTDKQLPPHVRVSIEEDKFPAGIAADAVISV